MNVLKYVASIIKNNADLDEKIKRGTVVSMLELFDAATDQTPEEIRESATKVDDLKERVMSGIVSPQDAFNELKSIVHGVKKNLDDDSKQSNASEFSEKVRELAKEYGIKDLEIKGSC